MEAYRGKVLSYDDLKKYTNDFSKDNFIGRFQFGKVYRGMMDDRHVTVKVWEDPKIYKVIHPEDNVERLQEEIYLLKHLTIESHRQMVNMIGYCSNGEHLSIVYDLKPLDSVHNLIITESFSWVKRIKVALQIACLIEYFHAPREPYHPFLIRNIDAAHIMLDQDHNAKLFDFSMIAGGIFPERRDGSGQMHGCYGYIDPSFGHAGNRWSEKNDVFAFGVLLLELITKRVFDLEEARKNIVSPYVHEWAIREYKARKSIMGFGQRSRSLVHPSFETVPDFIASDGPKITKLAMQCVRYSPPQRPTMKQVVDHLLNLHVVQHDAYNLGVGQLIRGRNPNPHKANLFEMARQLICNRYGRH